MTRRHRGSFSRLDFVRAIQIRCPSSKQRAQGKPGADCARSTVCKGEKERTRIRQVQPRHPGFPAQWFDGLYVLSPVSGVYCHRCHAGTGRRGWTPRSRRQDHTTSPYAADVSPGERTRLTPQRPSHPGPTYRDDRETSLKRAGARMTYFRIAELSRARSDLSNRRTGGLADPPEISREIRVCHTARTRLTILFRPTGVRPR